MTDKKPQTKETKEDASMEATDTTVEATTGPTEDFEKEDLKPRQIKMEDEDLPEDIKKRLEDRKNDKSVKKKGRKKKKNKEKVSVGKVFIKATYNNTIVTATDLNGNVLSWASAGMAGFKGPKKATSYAASIIAKIACMKAKEDFDLRDVSVFIRGVGTGREAAVRAVNANGLNITSIKDITPVPHNGCRPKKPRRV